MATTLLEGAQLINKAMSDLGITDYQIDTTSNETITEGLKTIGAYPPSMRNTIMEQMNLIIQQRNFGVMFNAEKNDFRNFLVDMTPNGFGIEDIYHELIEATDPLWDDKSEEANERILQDLVSYDENKIAKAFHTHSFASKFKTTIDERNYDKVFTAYGVTRYVDTKLANLQWSAEVYLMQVAIDLIREMVENQKLVFRGGHNPNTRQGLANLVEDVKATINGFMLPTTLYNVGIPEYNDSGEFIGYRKTKSMTNSENDVFIITTPEMMERAKVQGYANAFNLSQYELRGRVLYAPAGTDLGEFNGEKVLFIALDRRAIVLGIKRWIGTSFFIPNANRVNHWLLNEGIKGYNTFFNAVAFTGESVDDFFTEGQKTIVTVRDGGVLGNDYSGFRVNGKQPIINKISVYGAGTNYQFEASVGDKLTFVGDSFLIEDYMGEIYINPDTVILINDNLSITTK